MSSNKNARKEKFNTLHKKWKNCKRCKLHECRNKVVVGSGNLHARYLIIGQNPGRQEDEKGIPFIGKSGKTLNDMIKFASDGMVTRDMFYVTNAVACLSPGNREPTDSEMKACSKRLNKIISILDPYITICLGKFAIKSMFKDFREEFGVSACKGLYRRDKLPRVDKKRYIYNTYHPSYINRNMNVNEHVVIEWSKDWKKICELILEFEDEK